MSLTMLSPLTENATMARRKVLLAVAPALLLLIVAGAACWQEEEQIPAPEATLGLSDVTVEQVYSRVAEALARPGSVFHAVVDVERQSPEGTFSGEMRVWLDVERDLGRQEYRREGPDAVQPYEEITIVAGGASYRRTAGRPTEATAAPTCRGTNSAALSLLLSWWSCWKDFLTQVMTGATYDRRPAVHVVTEGSSWGEDDFTFKAHTYLDEETFLPLASTTEWVDVGEPNQSFQLTMRFRNEFVLADSLPADFFDPASIGYVYQDPAEPLDELDPSLTVYWLGKEFPGVGELPGLALSQVYIPEERSWPSYEAILDYRLTEEPFGSRVVMLQEWRNQEWQALLDQALGASWWDSPCVRSREEPLEDGHAVIFMGYENQPLPQPFGAGQPIEEMGCPEGPFDSFMAHTYLGSTVVMVDATSDSPYDSLEGIRAVVQGLEARE